MEEILNDSLFKKKIISNKSIYLSKVLSIYIFLNVLASTFLANKKILNWKNVRNDFELLANKYKYLIKKEKNIEEDSPIWMMWYQGIENAPLIVQSCIKSVILNRAKHPVYIISKYNLNKYIKLPKYIIQKLNSGYITITHFSDIVRAALLYKYGGYWIDATYFINRPLTKVNTTFFTIKLSHCWRKNDPIINCLWSINFMASTKNSFISTYSYMALIHYWKKYNRSINYFLLDYIVLIAYNKIAKFKQTILNLPNITCSIFSLNKLLNSIHIKNHTICSFNKLKKTAKGVLFIGKKKTNYGYIVKKYKLDLKNENENIFIK
jgi:hypothetical protein